MYPHIFLFSRRIGKWYGYTISVCLLLTGWQLSTREVWFFDLGIGSSLCWLSTSGKEIVCILRGSLPPVLLGIFIIGGFPMPKKIIYCLWKFGICICTKFREGICFWFMFLATTVINSHSPCIPCIFDQYIFTLGADIRYAFSVFMQPVQKRCAASKWPLS